MKPIITLDFETEPILPRPDYPPRPVSFAVDWGDGQEEFLAWGHPTGNNATQKEAFEAIHWAWTLANRGGAELLFHNAKFDIAVAEKFFHMQPLPWHAVHDTMFLAFLADPHAPKLGLKELCFDLLDWPADEQDAVAEWVWDHRARLKQEFGGNISRQAKSGPSACGAWIGRCPADIVEPYALGDVRRTRALFDHLWPIIEREGMADAYDRERRVLPIFMQNEGRGLRGDHKRLQRDIERYEKALGTVESWMRKRLSAYGLNFNADRAVADAFDAAGIVDPDRWTLTKTGQKSVSKTTLTEDCFTDPQFAQAWSYRNRLTTALNTFMVPWHEQMTKTNGRIHTTWNQVRGEHGTRTGRPSTTKPNLLNIPKEFKIEKPDFIAGVPPLPNVRRYILPEEGHLFLHRDFDGQELRVFAHYECGTLQREYLKNPDLDPHGWVRDIIRELAGLDLDRTKVKGLNFQAIYGGGIPAAAKLLGVSQGVARQYKQFHDEALPGRRILNEEIIRLVRQGEPVVTWGGRKYFVEPPKVIDGKLQTFEYKLINYICQGSAADITKEVMTQYFYNTDRMGEFICQVYDELNISAPEECAQQEMSLLRYLMNNVTLSVPMRSSGKIGPNWGALKETD